eukprot:1911458-Pyramimonas_sp.AAC.1
MINSQTSSQINGQIISQININITEIQDISGILDRAMFHHSQQEDKVMHHGVRRRRHQQHLLRATWSWRSQRTAGSDDRKWYTITT